MGNRETPEEAGGVQKLYERSSGGFLISTDPGKLQRETVFDFLARSYWAKGRPRPVIERSLENSLCFGIYAQSLSGPTSAARSSDAVAFADRMDRTGWAGTADPSDLAAPAHGPDRPEEPTIVGAASPRQVGFARVVTDYATFAWLCDVFVMEEYRGQGLGKWLVETVLAHPELQGLRRWMLATADAHDLYRQFGFVDVSAPERWMERFRRRLRSRRRYRLRQGTLRQMPVPFGVGRCDALKIPRTYRRSMIAPVVSYLRSPGKGRCLWQRGIDFTCDLGSRIIL